MLKSEPSNFADEEGRRHPVHGTTRLKIPAALLGKEKEELRFGSFEERRVDMSHKQHKMSDEDKAAWLLETRQGLEIEAVGPNSAKKCWRISRKVIFPASSISGR